MFEKFKIAAKAMTSNKGPCPVRSLKRGMFFLICTSSLLVTSSCVAFGPILRINTQPNAGQENSVLQQRGHYWNSPSPVRDLNNSGYYRALGYEGNVYSNGQDIIKFSNEKTLVLGVGEKYYFNRINKRGKKIGPKKVWGSRFGGSFQEYRP